MKKFFLLIVFFSMVTTLKAEDLEELIKSGNQLFSAGDYEKAKVKYLACLAEKKDESSILYNLGNVEFKLKHFKESLNYYQDALKLKPNDYLVRNLLYHLGNVQQALAHENMQGKAPDNKAWDSVLNIINSVEISTPDKSQRVVIKKMIDELKKFINDKDFENAGKCLKDIEDTAKNSKDKNLMTAVENIKKELGNDKENLKTKNLESQIEKVKQSIANYEESFQSYRKSLEVSRKIGIKEGRDISEVGNYIKNNWAIGRERWSLLYEELNRLMKENLKLKEGVADLIKVQEELYSRLEMVYMNSQLQEILDYNLKVLAEFHADYKQDIIQLEKIADEDLNTKKTELENLKNTQKQAQGKAPAPDQEKISYDKQEKEIINAEKISKGLRNVEGFENFIEDSLKRGDLFNARRNAFQMLTFLKSLNDYLNNTAPIDRTFTEMHNQLNIVLDLINALDSKEEVKAEIKGSVADNKFKSIKIIQEKLIDDEYLNEQLCLYLDDYIKEGSLKSENENAKESPESKWLLEVLNSFVKTIVTKLVQDLKSSQNESKIIRENLTKNLNIKDQFQLFKEKNNQQFSTYKNALLGMVEGVQKGIDQLDAVQDNLEGLNDLSFFYQLLDNKLQFLIQEMEKENAPVAFKESLPFIKQKLQHYQEMYPVVFDQKKEKELRLTNISIIKDDLSKIIFFIDPMKTMIFKFSKLIQNDSEIFKAQENAEKQRVNVQKQVDEIKSYFDILISSMNKQLNEAQKPDNSKDDPKNGKKDNNENQEAILQDWKKSQSLLITYEKSTKSLDLKTPANWDLNTELHKVYGSGLLQSALRFQGQPNQATDTLKLAIELQKKQKELTKELVDKRWKDQINNPSLEVLKAFQQENVEMMGVRGINQVLKMKEESEKAPAQPTAPKDPNAEPEKKPDFEAAINFIKTAVNEGDKIVSFYEVREFSNTPEKHDKTIEALTKALEILEKKNPNQDKNKDQENKDQQNKEQQAEASPQEENSGDDKDKSDKKKEERKPLELTPEQARQLLNDLNKKDEGQKKPVEKKKAINTPRPW